MPDKEMWNIYQMVNHVIELMDKAETPENEQLFEKIRWALGEQEHTIVTLANCLTNMQEAFTTFSEQYTSAREELNQKYRRPMDVRE